jgi:hypothetical protein
MEQRADNAGVFPLQADETITRPLWSRPTRQYDAWDSESWSQVTLLPLGQEQSKFLLI